MCTTDCYTRSLDIERDGEMMTSLKVAGLAKEFKTSAETLRVLEGVNLQMSSGENLAIVGPSGCGKSTLLYILGTLDKPTSVRSN